MDADHSPQRHDLRSASVEYKRHNDRAAKWGLGGWTSRSCSCTNRRWNGEARPDEWNPNAPEWHARPVHAHPRSSCGLRHERDHAVLKQQRAERIDIVKEKKSVSLAAAADDDDDDNLTDSSPPIRSPDVDIFYSFDAPAGPAQGNHVLNYALTQAVERFEVKQTDKLIREEYEVVQPEAEPSGTSNKERVPLDVDGFELV